MRNILPRRMIEKIFLMSVWYRPHTVIMGSKIFYTPSETEKLVLQNRSDVATVNNMEELEKAMNSPLKNLIFIDKSAAITSLGLKKIIERTSLNKTIFCAFKLTGIA